MWLDALQCRVRGYSVRVVATHTDQLAGNVEGILKDLQLRVERCLSTQRIGLEQAGDKSLMPSDVQQGLNFHGVKHVSSACTESLLDLRLSLSELVYSKRDISRVSGEGSRYPGYE